ncbi:hypothetical protein [Actinacidiphila glaucinigra]|uniref:hypothetical protein n=1 Tax=Actinacidiphila glaucinigra TaxID=235986 RepID=UPI0037F81C73
MGEDGLLVELTRHLMQAAVEAEMDLHLQVGQAELAGRGADAVAGQLAQEDSFAV